MAESVSAGSNALSVLTSAFDALGPVAQSAVQTLLWGAAAYLLVLKRITVAQITAALTNPFVRIGAVIAGVLLLLDDFAVFMRGGKSYINWGPVAEFFKKIRDFGTMDWFKALPDKITEAFKSFGDKIKAMWTDVVNWLSSKWDAFIQTVTGWMPDSLKKQLGIKAEGDAAAAPEFKAASATPAVTQVLDTDPQRQAIIRQAGGVVPAAPAAPVAPPPGRVMTALLQAERAASPAVSAGVQPGAAPVVAGAQSWTNIVNNAAAAGRTLSAAQPLGSTNITNNIDAQKKYDVNIPVTNNTTVNITNMAGDSQTNAAQVTDAVDNANAKLVRDVQTPLAAIADQSGSE